MGRNQANVIYRSAKKEKTHACRFIRKGAVNGLTLPIHFLIVILIFALQNVLPPVLVV